MKNQSNSNQNKGELSSKISKPLIRMFSLFLTFLFAVYLLWPAFGWLIRRASIFSMSPESCFVVSDGGNKETITGACWPAVWDNLTLLMVGRYPLDQVWRVFVAFGSLIVTYFIWRYLSLKQKSARKRLPPSVSIFVVCGGLFFAFIFFRGFEFFFLEVVESSKWGGFSLTLLLSIVGIGLGFPLGLVLALFRTSTLPVLKLFAMCYIESVRGVPLITLLFLANYLLPLFLPSHFGSVNEILRAQTAIVLFSGAYLAEVIRGGLASVDFGQKEAATALGMGYISSMRHIVLPQALRVSLPALVSTFIGLIKDTSLVAVIGIFDLLGVARNIPSNPKWIGRDLEPLLFAALFYFILCWLLSRFSKRFEINFGATP